MLIIGITGIAGSGKSMVSKYMHTLSIPIVSADLIAKQIVNTNNDVLNAITNYFGAEVLLEDNSLDRQALRMRIFSNMQDKIWLEALLHPLIRAEIHNQVLHYKQTSSAPYCAIEIPLLYSREDYPYIDRVLLVYAATHIILLRLMQRDQLTLTQARALYENHLDDSARRLIADDFIENNGSLVDLNIMVHELHQKYQKLSML